MRTFAISAVLAAGLAFSGFVLAQDAGQAQPAAPAADQAAPAAKTAEAAKPTTKHTAMAHTKHHAKHHHAAKKSAAKGSEPAKTDGGQQ